MNYRENLFRELALLPENVLITSDKFFLGNDDDSSIGRKLTPHPGISTFRNIFLQLQNRTDVTGIYVFIRDTMPSSGWPFTDTIYVAGSISTKELADILEPLHPSEIGPVEEFDYDVPDAISEKHPSENIQLIWWD